ncbi:hypothetical protein J4216_03595 [Candidatus Woesearchaeota archaeon]|nr:hypothetical protein [Candidatus Woesearchaeota archaeon]
MLNKLKQELQRLKSSNIFQNKGFLAGCFLMSEIKNFQSIPWQLDFYIEETNRMTAYLMNQEIEIIDNSEVFKKEEMKIEELNLDEIKTEFTEAKELAEDVLLKHKEIPLKLTIILQKQNVPIWNFIYITKNFNLLNIKINALNSKIIEDKFVSLISFERTKN